MLSTEICVRKWSFAQLRSELSTPRHECNEDDDDNDDDVDYLNIVLAYK